MLRGSFNTHILHFNKPAGTSRGYLTTKISYIISLTDTHKPGIAGTGECSLIQNLSPDPEKDYEKILAGVCATPEKFLSFSNPALNHYPSIRFGLETAWKDLQGGGNKILFPSEFTDGKTGIPINGLIWMDSKKNMLKQARRRIEEGFRCVKMKIGALDFDEELDLIKTLRREFRTEELILRVDANGAFHYGEAPEKLKKLSEQEIHSIEQPIKSGNWDMMAALCEKSPVPIALDEELFFAGADENKSRLLATIRPAYLVLKPSMLGGFEKSMEWIHAANVTGSGWWITSALESNIGLNALAQWTFTLNNPVHHGLGTGKLFSNNFPATLSIENGLLKMKEIHRDVALN